MNKAALALALLSPFAFCEAAQIGSSSDGNWTTVFNPQPGSEDVARVKHEVEVTTTIGTIKKTQVAGGHLIIRSDGSLTSTDLDFGHTGGATVTVDGGALYSLNTTKVGNSNAEGALTINNDGLLSVAGNFFVGANGNNGSLTLNSGSITAKNLALGQNDTATQARVDLLGGTMTLETSTFNINVTTGGSSTFNMENDARLIVAGNKINQIDGYITDTHFTWSNGDGANNDIGDQTWSDGSGSFLHATFDGENTTVWTNTIPEPATITLLGLCGLFTLALRRRV